MAEMTPLLRFFLHRVAELLYAMAFTPCGVNKIERRSN